MTIYVVKTFRGYWVTASEEEAVFKANKLYEELRYDCREHRVVSEDVWCRIDIYVAKDDFGMPFVYRECYWHRKYVVGKDEKCEDEFITAYV